MKIVTVPHQLLRQKSAPVTKPTRSLKRLLTDLQSTLTHSDIGVGLAAPQLGQNLRVFALNLPDPTSKETPIYRYFINPVITQYASKQALGTDPKGRPDLEGCLSVPHIYAPVARPIYVDVTYQQLENGQLTTHQEHFADFAARVFQHEYDHLEGRLFTDLALAQHTQLYLDVDGDLQKITATDLFTLFGGEF